MYNFCLFMLQSDCFSFHDTTTAILIQSFARFIMGDILADTAIPGNAVQKELLCSCYKHTSRACLQLNGMGAEKEGFVCQENLSTCNFSWRTLFSFRLDSYFPLLNLSFVLLLLLLTLVHGFYPFVESILTTFAKQSMINQLPNSINNNHLTAKISKVMRSK